MANGNEREIGIIIEKLENIEESQKEIKTDMKDGFAKLNGRVRKLENWRSGIVAVFSFIIIVAGFLVRFWK